MKLHIETDRHDRGGVELYLNGKLSAEIAVDQCQTRDDLEARLRRARCADATGTILDGLIERIRTIVNIEDHINCTTAAKQQQFCRGVNDGLAQKTVPHPFAGVPPMTPDHTRSYLAGYEYGEALSRCAIALRNMTI